MQVRCLFYALRPPSESQGTCAEPSWLLVSKSCLIKCKNMTVKQEKMNNILASTLGFDEQTIRNTI